MNGWQKAFVIVVITAIILDERRHAEWRRDQRRHAPAPRFVVARDDNAHDRADEFMRLAFEDAERFANGQVR